MTANSFEDRALNYVTANRFYVEMGGTLAAAFTECSGLSAKIKREVHLEGGVNDQQRIILGAAEYTDVVLKRGITNDLTFWDWINKTLLPGPKQRRNLSILLFNAAGETMQSWMLIGAIPVGWKAPPLQATANQAAIEELTLAYEGLRIEAKSGGGATVLENGRDKTGYFSNR